MFDCLCGVVNEVRMNVSDLQRLAGQRSDKYSEIIAKKLSALDGDGDGGIDSNELVNGIVELIDAEKVRRCRYVALNSSSAWVTQCFLLGA